MTTPSDEVYGYRHGWCYPMAAALSELTGWPVSCIVADVPSDNHPLPWWPHVAHAYVVSPEGRAFDAGGFQDEEALMAEFADPQGRRFRNARIEAFEDAEAFHTYLGSLYGEGWERDKAAYHDPMVDDARRLASSRILPTHLPGRVGPSVRSGGMSP